MAFQLEFQVLQYSEAFSKNRRFIISHEKFGKVPARRCWPWSHAVAIRPRSRCRRLGAAPRAGHPDLPPHTAASGRWHCLHPKPQKPVSIQWQLFGCYHLPAVLCWSEQTQVPPQFKRRGHGLPFDERVSMLLCNKSPWDGRDFDGRIEQAPSQFLALHICLLVTSPPGLSRAPLL